MTDRLERMVERHKELEQAMMNPDLPRDQKRYVEVMQEHASLTEIVEAYRKLQTIDRSLTESRELLESERDPSMREMVREEVVSLEQARESMEQSLRILLVPKDPLDAKHAIVEIRAGTGGDEAALFAADLYRMYQRFAEHRGWKVEILSSNPTEIGGYKEIIYSLTGKQVYGDMKYESGVHRVQRVPETESGGRIHTSAVTVAVLPEAEEHDVVVNQEDLRIDVFRSSGPGGQSVNTTDSAVRVTHIPTGLVVICQDEKSQLKNKAKALRVLKARLYEMEQRRRQEEEAAARRSQIGSGDRSERIRTYNFPQNRFTDHRINMTAYNLDSVMQGELDDAINALKMTDRESFLRDHA